MHTQAPPLTPPLAGRGTPLSGLCPPQAEEGQGVMPIQHPTPHTMKLSFDYLNGFALGIAFPPGGITVLIGPVAVTFFK